MRDSAVDVTNCQISDRISVPCPSEFVCIYLVGACLMSTLGNLARRSPISPPTTPTLSQIKLQSLEDTLKYTLGKYTLENYTLVKYMYIFLKSIAAIIHFRALMPPYTQVAFRPPYTPRSIYAFLQPQISVCMPRLYMFFEEHCCHHTFPSIAASIQPSSI